MKFLTLALLLPQTALALSLMDYPNASYEVRFTNPQCRTYEYDEPVRSRGGAWLKAKPKNAYCKRGDYKKALRGRTPIAKLLEWIGDEDTHEIFMAYLSFSEGSVADALVEAVEDRDLKLRLVMDRGSPREAPRESSFKRLRQVERAETSEGEHPETKITGHTRGTGYAHNKVFIVNPNAPVVKIAFSSGNMSSGASLHHENWHFVEIDQESYFAQAHLCLMNGIWENDASRKEFTRFIKDCKADIEAPEEDDMKTFFVPGEGKEAMEYIQWALEESDSVDLAAHRFLNSDLMGSLGDFVAQDKGLRMVFDDDLFWAAHGQRDLKNQAREYYNAKDLTDEGAQVRYIETNSGSNLLHHNKFMVFYEDTAPWAVFTGAGNFTKAAFTKNFENFYFIQIPEVLEEFASQYDYLYGGIGSRAQDLPKRFVEP